jgi:glycosyltransferase involved in cell wall biosynthesis
MVMMAVCQDRPPKISIIIPVYKTATLIADCLNSVLAQTYTDFEAIVVNDGSPDTPELEIAIAPYLNRIVYIKQENKGAAGARNTAIQRARGEFLAFLDSDDVWFPEHLASQMKLFEEDSTLDMAYSDCLVGDHRHQWKFMDRCPSHGEPNFGALVVGRCHIPVLTVVVRKSAIVKAGLFDESLPRCDDYDMWLRTAFHGAKIGYTRRLQARCSGVRPDSLSQLQSNMAKAFWMILEKTGRTLSLSKSQSELIIERTQESRANYLLEEGKRQLRNRQFTNAKELLAEANQHFRRRRIRLTLLGLDIAPGATSKIVSVWNILLMLKCRLRFVISLHS